MDSKIIARLVKRFVEKPGRMDMGSGKMSRRYKCKPQEAFEARRIARDILRGNTPKTAPEGVKILIFDIETAPLLGYVWGTFKQHISPSQLLTKMHYMLTWVAKWSGSEKLISAKMTVEEIDDEDDSRISQQLRDLFDEADIVIGHNIDKFDIPIVNTRCLIAGIKPPSPYQTVDTFKVSKKSFRFPNNKLQTIANAKGMDGKSKTDFDMWKDCLIGSNDNRKKAIDAMLKYNQQDVVVQEEVYLWMRPWIKSHPNVALYVEDTEMRCTNCGSDNLSDDKEYTTGVNKFKTYRCNCCGAIAGRARKSTVKGDKKNTTLMPVAR